MKINTVIEEYFINNGNGITTKIKEVTLFDKLYPNVSKFPTKIDIKGLRKIFKSETNE